MTLMHLRPAGQSEHRVSTRRTRVGLVSERPRGPGRMVVAAISAVAMSAGIADDHSPLDGAAAMFRAAVREAGAGDTDEQLRTLFRDRLAAVDALWISAWTRTMLDAPLDAAAHAEDLAGPVATLAQPAALIATQLDRFAQAFSVGRRPCDLPATSEPGGASAPEVFVSVFTKAAVSASGAFAAVPEEEGKRFLAQLGELLAEAAAKPDDRSDAAAQAFAQTLPRIVGQVDFGLLDCAMRHLAAMTDPASLAALRTWAGDAKPIARPDWLDARILGDFLWAEQTEQGIFLVGAGGTNIYGASVAAIIDTGGDDAYIGRTGSGRGTAAGWPEGAPRAQVIVDLDGDDRYLSPGDVSAGGAVMGVSLLYDAAGDDVYAASRIAQGAGIIGHGALIDGDGDDHYALDAIGQGAALAGTGLALDGTGSDYWSAALLAQGSGGPMGLGVLVDRHGDDVFSAGGRYPSAWGTPGVFQALGQGTGWGIRPALAGGIGLLDDRGGDDTYLGGNFSQGAGYFLGAGVLVDASGNDRYRGTRYSQGSAAHLAAGVLVDGGGHDNYLGEIAANQGAAWDLAVGVLQDAAGDDAYRGADLSQGSAAQNGVGLFLDAGGADRFVAPDSSQGHSGQLSYGEGRGSGNLAVFVDLGKSCGHRTPGKASYRIAVNGTDRVSLPPMP